MKKAFILGVFTAMMIAMVSFSSCSKNDGDGGGGGSSKVSPPSWIRGSWGVEGYEVFKFTSDDVFLLGESLKAMTIVSASGSITLKETKNTSSAYEIILTAKSSGEKAAAIFSFKKGDGTYIDAASNEEGGTVSADDYERLDKIN